MSLPESEEEIEQKLNEAEKKLKKKTGISIKFDREGFEKQVLEKKALEEELEAERTLREDYESKLRIIAEQKLEEKKKELNAPSWITTPTELNKWAEAEGIGDKGAGGNVKLRPEDLQRERHSGSGEKEYDDSLDLLLDVQKNQPEVYEQIKEKAIKGLSEGKQGFKFEDSWKDGKSIIRRILDEANERKRAEFSKGD